MHICGRDSKLEGVASTLLKAPPTLEFNFMEIWDKFSNQTTVPAPIKDAASIQNQFLNLRTMVQFTESLSLAYSKNRQIQYNAPILVQF